MFLTICTSLPINRNLGKSSQDQRCFSHLKPGNHHWTPPIVHLQHPHFCEEPHWGQRTQQRAHRNHWWSRCDLLVIFVMWNQINFTSLVLLCRPTFHQCTVHVTLSSYFWYLNCIGLSFRTFFIHRTNSNASILLMSHFLLNCSISWHREAIIMQYCQLVVKGDITGEWLMILISAGATVCEKYDCRYQITLNSVNVWPL